MVNKKKIILWFILMLIVVFIAWIIMINISENKVNYEVITKDGKTLYHVEALDYEIVDDSDLVMIETEKYGVMVVELYPTIAPITVKNFKKLVSEKFYDGIIFHRVIKDFVIQGGDPTGTGASGSEETIKGEFKLNGFDNKLSHQRGVISMARAGTGSDETETPETMNSASSQFFIVHKDATSDLDGRYAAFGLLVNGYTTLDKIANVSTDENDKPVKDVVIKQARFVKVYRGN